MSKNEKIRHLKRENRALKETCEILADKKVMNDIQKSLEEIKKGNYITPSEL